LSGLHQRTRSIAIWLCFAVCVGARADQLDDLIVAQMSQHRITGLSLAVIEGGRIVREKGFGFADKGRRIPVEPATLFQAGSISKSVAAVGALWLVEQGRLSLDADVNSELHSWKAPENSYTKT